MDSPFRWGILGTASIADRFVAGVKSAGGSAGEVRAMAGRIPDKTHRRAEALGIPLVFDGYARLLAQDTERPSARKVDDYRALLEAGVRVKAASEAHL